MQPQWIYQEIMINRPQISSLLLSVRLACSEEEYKSTACFSNAWGCIDILPKEFWSLKKLKGVKRQFKTTNDIL